MSIKPQFADAIFSGAKQFEFRRAIFRCPVSVVVVYTTSPVSQIVGEFEVAGVLRGTPRELWKRTRRWAGISRERFFKYFTGCQTGYAIEIGAVSRYVKPVNLPAKGVTRPPQSFVYLERTLSAQA